ncbi:hypothetical protein D7V68_03625 [Acinetobacter cumulans]|uniref:hypothetical protein n=1 Tax=Acinetobacter cumulans TaxID=2136182 RepID=UPI000EA355BD|nr:hypothetical protein [Acinetobacter cumulans]RKG50348.1 hypothetical protein D7V68_03625 [Acinetobacter cumulans]
MVASTDIKFFVHSNNNAPQLQNAYGSMIGVLDACLVNGVSLGPVSTLTAVGTTVTAVFGTAHNLMQYQVLKITGANQAEYNGEHRILSVPNATSVTFQLANTPSVATATGTIIASLPPLGWEKPFSSTNEAGGGKAAYRSKNVLLPSRPFLRVVDELDPVYTATYAKFAKVGIVEDMADINTMLGVQAPFNSTIPGRNWVGTGSGAAAINGWARWYYAHNRAFGTLQGTDTDTPVSGSRSWILVGNTDYFYILPTATPSNTTALPYGFGCFKSLLNSDSACNFLSATLSDSFADSTQPKQRYTPLSGNNTTEQKILLQRGYTQSAQYFTGSNISLGVTGSIQSGLSDYIGPYSLTSVAVFAPVFINETVLRGEIPNLYWLFQDKPYANYQIIERNGNAYIAVNIGASTSAGIGQIVLKIGE